MSLRRKSRNRTRVQLCHLEHSGDKLTGRLSHWLELRLGVT